jgi:hypothetical protein
MNGDVLRLFKLPGQVNWIESAPGQWKHENCIPIFREPQGDWVENVNHRQETIWFLEKAYNAAATEPTTVDFPEWIECRWDKQAGRWVVVISVIPIVRPVLLSNVGGSDGTSSSPATWTYSVTDALLGTLIYDNANAINPTTAPHLCKRPPVGSMLNASAGTGYYDSSGVFILLSFNEVPNPSAC